MRANPPVPRRCRPETRGIAVVALLCAIGGLASFHLVANLVANLVPARAAPMRFALLFTDTLYLDDGRVLDGKIISESRKEVVIEIAVSGLPLRKTIPRGEISRIVRHDDKADPPPSGGKGAQGTGPRGQGAPRKDQGANPQPSSAEDGDRDDAGTGANGSGDEGSWEGGSDDAALEGAASRAALGAVPPDVAAAVAQLPVRYRFDRLDTGTFESKVVSLKRKGKPFMPVSESQSRKVFDDIEAVRMRIGFAGSLAAEIWIEAMDPVPLLIVATSDGRSHVAATSGESAAQVVLSQVRASVTSRIDATAVGEHPCS